MIAKLAACRGAFAQGVEHVSIVAGRDVANFEEAPGTRIVQSPAGVEIKG
jgi:hypothetical protein